MQYSVIFHSAVLAEDAFKMIGRLMQHSAAQPCTNVYFYVFVSIISSIIHNNTTKMVQATWRAHPKNNGKGSRACRVCNNSHGLVRKYGLNLCRRCFREYANDIGFKKFR